jgi:hypothetical protein
MSNPGPLRITPKRLGKVAMQDFCPFCFWFLLRLRFRPPFDQFAGGIFKALEKAQIAIVDNLLQKNGELPEPFDPFCDVVGRVEFPRDWRKFHYHLPDGTELYGEPDDIFNLVDGTIAVVDHKSAKPKGGEDPFLPCYETQVIGYGLIAEKGLKLGRVSKGGLFYWAAADDSVVNDPGKHFRGEQLWVPFTPTVIPVEIDYKKLAAPLKEARLLWNSSTPPDGTRGCPHCKRLEALFAIQEEIVASDQLRDSRILSGAGDKTWALRNIGHRSFDNVLRRNAAREWLCSAEEEYVDLVEIWETT